MLAPELGVWWAQRGMLKASTCPLPHGSHRRPVGQALVCFPLSPPFRLPPGGLRAFSHFLPTLWLWAEVSGTSAKGDGPRTAGTGLRHLGLLWSRHHPPVSFFTGPHRTGGQGGGGACAQHCPGPGLLKKAAPPPPAGDVPVVTQFPLLPSGSPPNGLSQVLEHSAHLRLLLPAPGALWPHRSCGLCEGQRARWPGRGGGERLRGTVWRFRPGAPRPTFSC